MAEPYIFACERYTPHDIMEKLRLIQCGVGGFGGGWVRDIVPTSPDFQLAAIVDVSDEALKNAGEVAKVPPAARFRSLADAVKNVHADAVLTVTPPAVHVEHARIAFGNGLHLITEKPLADTITNAREMVRLAESARKQLVVSQNYRYKPQVVLLNRLVTDKSAGELGHGHIDFYIPAEFPGTFRETMEFPLLVDMCIHHMDLLRAITGKNIVNVSVMSFKPKWSWYKHEPGLKMLLEMEDGIVFSYSGDWSAKGRFTPWDGNWRLQCADGALLWEDGKVSVTRCDTWMRNYSIQYPDPPQIPFEGQRATLHSLAEAIRTGVPAPTNGKDNLNSLGTVMAAVASAKERRPINVREFVEA
jgi:predicted dehydrogenase